MKKGTLKFVVAVVLISVMVFALAACSQSPVEEPTAEAPASEDSAGAEESAAEEPSAAAEKPAEETEAAGGAEKITIVAIPKLVHEFYNYVEDGINDAIEVIKTEKGNEVELIWSAPSTADSVEQAQKLEAAVALKPNAIMISVIDGEMCKPIMESAIEQGIKVVAFDTDFEGSPADAFVGCSLEAQKESGSMAADMLVKLMGKEEGQVAMLTGSPDAENHKLFSGGFEERMTEAYPNIEIVTKQADNDDKEKATSLSESILAQYPDIDGIFGGDGSAGVGAAVAFKSAVDAGQFEKGDVQIVQYCLMNDPAEMMKEGYLQGLVDYPPYLLGYYGTMMIEAYFNDGVELQDLYLPFGEVYEDNMDTYIQDYMEEQKSLEYWNS
ncbi:sugar ABC transporter substrate-binding protein [Christensenella hongkongensis]|uniref:sugar ABC transporter substrate-binding protein n=1 Tax=Christensenella hongkongensis TaxID=270498 RepID=UPI0026730F11|nr:substrate-binding domain-containing protein [Christensenella hongkongensis]